MNIFYRSDAGIEWFDSFANLMIWLLIVAGIVFIFWVGIDVITGPRKQREEIRRMLHGLDTVQDITGVSSKISSHKAGATDKRKLVVPERDSMPITGEKDKDVDTTQTKRRSPFAPGQAKRRKLTSDS